MKNKAPVWELTNSFISPFFNRLHCNIYSIEFEEAAIIIATATATAASTTASLK